MTKPVALVVGAGIAGLASAWWLDKAGWQSIVVERAETFRVGGYTMTISGLGYETVKHMNLLDEFQSQAQKFDCNIINDQNGKELCRVKYADVHGGLDALAVRRDDLAQILAKSLPGSCTIRFQETVSEFTEEGDKVRVALTGGDTIESDLLIGADGFRSQIRRSLWKDEDEERSFLEPLGYYYAAYNFSQQEDTQNDCHSFNRPGQLDMLFSMRDKGMTAMHIWREDRVLPADSARDKFNILHRVTAKSVPQVREAVDRADRVGALVNMDGLSLVDLPRWSKGRVVLLGDAAHCLTLLSGQGAGMALVSAEILGKELQKTSDVFEALRNHEKKLRPSIKGLQSRSRRMAGWYIPKSSIAYFFRNLILKILPYTWIVGFHISTLKSEIDLT